MMLVKFLNSQFIYLLLNELLIESFFRSGRTSETQEEFPPTRRVFDPMLSQANFPTLDQ